MCGNATLTIVVSTTCMTVASMTATVIMPRFSGAAALAVTLVAVALMEALAVLGKSRVVRQQRAHPLRRGLLVARVDVDDRAHAGAQRRIVAARFDGDTHGNALRDLDPVAGRVLRRDHR